MSAKETFFRPNKNILGGYYIPVRNNWNYHIIWRLISEKQKELYENDFGEEIITDDDFYNWLKKSVNLISIKRKGDRYEKN